MLPIKNEIKKICSSKKKMEYLSKEAVLNSDGTNIFNLLQQDIKIKNDKLIYTETDHRLKYMLLFTAVRLIDENHTAVNSNTNKRRYILFIHLQMCSA